MSLTALKPIETAIPDKDSLIATDILQRLALGAVVKASGGRMMFSLSDLDWIRENTSGLTSRVISSQHTDERWLVIEIAEEAKESLIIQ